jgi:hypothetical protein
MHTPRRTTTIDWRYEICRFLELDPNASEEVVFEELQTAFAKMKEAERVKQNPVAQQGPVRYQVIHRVSCAGRTDGNAERVMYLEQPWTVHSGSYSPHLRGSQRVTNMELYLERNKDIIFLVLREYVCCGKKPHSINRYRLGREVDARPMSLLVAEYIDIASDDLRSRLAELSDFALQGIPHPIFRRVEDGEDDEGNEYVADDVFSEYDITDNPHVSYPYLWFYHRRQKILEAIDRLYAIDQEHLNVFCGYIQNRMADEWAAVDNLISKGEINAEHINYIYVSPLIQLVVLFSYYRRFQEKLLCRYQKGAQEPNYRHRWLQIGSISRFHRTLINSRPLS